MYKWLVAVIVSLGLFSLGCVNAEPSIVVSGVEEDTTYTTKELDVYFEARGVEGVKSTSVSIDGKDVSVDVVGGIFHFKVGESSKPRNIDISIVGVDGSKISTKVENVSVVYGFTDMFSDGTFYVVLIGILLGLSLVFLVVSVVTYYIVRNRDGKSYKENASMYLESTRLLSEED